MLLVGSAALHKVHPMIWPSPKDVDWIATPKEVLAHKPRVALQWLSKGKAFRASKGKPVEEYEVAWEGTTGDSLLKNLGHQPWKEKFADPEIILGLKMSHRFKKNSPFFLKTMRDIKALRKLGYEVGRTFKWLPGWVELREEETLWYDHPKLGVMAKDFFNPSVPYKYNHDDIHKVVAIEAHPAYKAYMVDGAEVLCSKKKFFALPLYKRLYGVMEEVMVLALERSLLPFPGGLSTEKAFLKALEKVSTSITSGWFREFAWENYQVVLDRLLEMEQHRPLLLLLSVAISQGKVRPYEGKGTGGM